MEDTLRDYIFSSWIYFRFSLNPCFNGRYSQRQKETQGLLKTSLVLILVLMEDTLRDFRFSSWYKKIFLS